MRQAIEEIKELAKYTADCKNRMQAITDICERVIAADDKERNAIRFDRINNVNDWYAI